MTLSIHSPDELIAALPHLLGFRPEDSLVFVPLSSDLPVARVDLPTTPEDRELVWQAVREGFTRYVQPGAGVAVVCLTTDRAGADVVSQEFASRLSSIGIDTRVRLWADDWQWCDLDGGDSGQQTAEARERIATMTVLMGRAQPVSSRDRLATSLVGDRELLAGLLPEAREAASRSTPQEESRWALARLKEFHVDGVRLSDGDAARLLVAVDAIPIRDRLWNDITRDSAASHVALWTDLSRRAPDDVRAAPASLLGFASWLSGHGALAWCALDQVPASKPYALANLVAAAVQGGLHPREWEALKSPPTERGLDPASDYTRFRPRGQLGDVRPAHGL